MIGILILGLLLSTACGAVLWPYSLNTWLDFFGRPESIVWWHGVLLGLCPGVGQFGFILAAVTFILMLFLV